MSETEEPEVRKHYIFSPKSGTTFSVKVWEDTLRDAADRMAKEFQCDGARIEANQLHLSDSITGKQFMFYWWAR